MIAVLKTLALATGIAAIASIVFMFNHIEKNKELAKAKFFLHFDKLHALHKQGYIALTVLTVLYLLSLAFSPEILIGTRFSLSALLPILFYACVSGLCLAIYILLRK